jgi:uncharacterized membrane protein
MAVHRSDLVASVLLVGVALVGFALWGDLPPEMAIHFDVSGTPDNYVPKPVALLLTPAIGLSAVAFSRYAIGADPSADPLVGAAAVYFVGGVVAYVHALVLAYNLGYGFSIWVALVPVFVASAGLVVWAVSRERF